MIARPTYTLVAETGEETIELGRFDQAGYSLDESRSPHVAGTVEIERSSSLPLETLDPRATVRVVLTVSETTERVFDLALRRRPIDTNAASMVLDLASDEALVEDFAPLADDETPFELASSIRDVVNYTLDSAIPGATLEGAPSTDIDVHPLWEVTNLHTNPLIVNTYGFGAGQGASGVIRVTFGSNAAIQWTTDAGTSNLIVTPSLETFRVRAGSWYVFSAEVLSEVPRNVYAAVQWFAGDSSSPMQTIYGTAVVSSTTEWAPVWVIARAPVGAEFMRPFVNTRSNAAGDLQYARRPMVHEGRRYVPPFSGESATDADYEYAWAESTHGSPSIRTPLRDTADPDAFTWRAGLGGMSFLRPLLQASGLRLVCDEQRRWTLRDESFKAPGSLNIREGVNLLEGNDVIDRDSGLWFDARLTRYRWRDRDGIEQERVDAFALQMPYTKLTELEIEAPYTGPGRSEYAVRRAQQRGREVTATVVADWSAQVEQSVTILLEGAPTQVGSASQISFDVVRNEMTVTTRTVEIPDNSVALFAAGVLVSELDGFVSELSVEDY